MAISKHLTLEVLLFEVDLALNLLPEKFLISGIYGSVLGDVTDRMRLLNFVFSGCGNIGRLGVVAGESGFALGSIHGSFAIFMKASRATGL